MLNAEQERLRALRELRVLDTLPEEGFDRLTALAAALFDAPIALVSLVDEERQWFKSRCGLNATETPRAWAFCNHAIAQGPNATFVVEDAAADARFSDNPLVTGDPHVRFYIGAALTNGAGQNLGTLCVIDRAARKTPAPGDVERLKVLARMVVDELELGCAKRAIADQKRLLELAEMMSGVGHWRYDMLDQRITWSDEVYRIHGVDRAAFDPNLDAGVAFYHPDDKAAVAAYVGRAIEFGEDYTFQLRLLRADGQTRIVSCKATCDMDAKGAPIAMFGVFQDVTEQVRTLETVAKSERRYRLLTENANDIVTEMDRGGVFTYVSPAVLRVTGYEVEEVIGRSAIEFIDPDDQDRVRDVFAKAVDDPSGWRIEYRVLCKDGRVIWVEARPTQARDPISGDFSGFTDVIRDITKRKLTETSLAQSETRYRLLADNASDIITQFDPGGRLTFISPGCRLILGYEPDALLGRRAIELAHPDDVDMVRAYYRDLRKASGFLPEPLQFRAAHKDRRWVWLEGQPKMFFEPLTGDTMEMQDVLRDITKRKDLESKLRHARTEAESAAAVKSEFLANMSHELRTPLTSILGFSKLLSEQTALDLEGRRYLERVSDASQSLLATVNDILDFSKLEAGQVEIAPRAVDPTAIITSALELLGPQAQAKALRLEVKCDNLPAQVIVDDTRLRQILLNLISNAVKFTLAGSVSVNGQYDYETHTLRCAVIDTGPGVPADRLDRLFKRFSQVDASTTRSHGGTGLGLAICKGLAEAMGGEVGADSELGVGSRFWIEIPCALVAETKSQSPIQGALCASTALPGLRALIVDDNLVNRELVRIILSPFGVDVSEADSGRSAIARAETEAFDLILMDVRMPDVDGPTAAQAIRSGAGPNKDAPIIAFTAEANNRTLPKAWEGLFNDQLPKPIIASDLLAMVDRWNSKKNAAPPAHPSLAQAS